MLLSLFLLIPLTSAYHWSTDDLALFDLVEQIGEDFYQVFQVERNAPLSDIKKAYRRLSLHWHPDKNSADNAVERFRQVQSIYEVLKSTNSRNSYNEILDNGLPDWRQPIYYYRHVRKMSSIETMILLLIILSIGHYLMLWAAYFERHLELSELFGNRRRKRERKLRRKQASALDDSIDAEMDEKLAELRPGWRSLLPYLLAYSCYNGILLVIRIIAELRQKATTTADDDDTASDQRSKRPPPIRQEVYNYDIIDDLKPVIYEIVDNSSAIVDNDIQTTNDQWTVEELSHLVKLTSIKYPLGSVNRWESIARVMNRSADDVIAMSGKLKQINPADYQKLCGGVVGIAPMTNVNNNGVSDDLVVDETTIWNQVEQRQLETAIVQFPKGTPERWEKISRLCGRTKEECVARYKELVELVRKRKTKK